MTDLRTAVANRSAGRRRLAGAGAVLAALAVQACTGVVVYGYFRHTTAGLDSELAYAGSRGPVHTRIYGNPFPVAKSRLASVVISEMTASAPGAAAKFSTRKAESPSPYRMALRFNGPRNLTDHALCDDGGGDSDAVQPAGRVHLAAAFCIGDEPLSSATGEAHNVTGVDDPRLRELVSQLTLVLFPPEEDDDDDDDLIEKII